MSMSMYAPAMAQTGAAALQLEEVVVTAQKRDTNLQKTSVSMQVTSGAQLREEGKRRIDEILRGTSGVEFQTNNFGANVFMRGLGNTEGIPGGGEKAVATIIDGAYQYRTEVLSNGTLDVAQVEVMRGSQGTTLGAGSLAGAVSLVSNKPVFEYQASGSIEGGNYNLINTEGVLNLPIADNQAMRVAYSSGKRDGYVSSGAGGTDNTNARLKYRWMVSDALDLVATYNFQKSFVLGRSDTVATDGYYRTTIAGDNCARTGVEGMASALGNGVDRCVYGSNSTVVHVANGVNFRDRANAWSDGFPALGWPNTPYRYNKINTFSSEINWDLGFGKLTLTPQVQSVRSVSNEAPSAMDAMDAQTDGTPISVLSYLHEDETETSRQIEARLASSDNSAVTWLAGVYYYFRDTPSTGGYTTYLTADPENNYFAGQTVYGGMGVVTKNNAETKSVFGNASYSILDTLRVLAGVRYSADSKEYVNASTPQTVTHDWSKTTYRVGAEYDLLPDSMLYATYQTGYQPGSINAMAMSGNLYTDAQTTEQITLGIKNQFFDNKLQLNVEAFDTTYHNRPFQGSLSYYIDTTLSNCNFAGRPDQTPAIVINAASTCASYTPSITIPNWKSKGVDVDLSWLPTSNDRVDLTAEYLKAEQGALPISFTADDIAAAGATANAAALAAGLNSYAAQYEGLTPQNSPEWVFNGTYQHKFALAGGSSLTPKINGIYKTKYWSQGGGPGANVVNPGAAYQKAYTKLDAYTTWQSADGRWSMTGYMKNLANEVIQINYGSQDVQLDAPRTFGATLNVNF